jgi:hypothetical protein
MSLFNESLEKYCTLYHVFLHWFPLFPMEWMEWKRSTLYIVSVFVFVSSSKRMKEKHTLYRLCLMNLSSPKRMEEKNTLYRLCSMSPSSPKRMEEKRTLYLCTMSSSSLSRMEDQHSLYCLYSMSLYGPRRLEEKHTLCHLFCRDSFRLLCAHCALPIK